MSEHLLNIREAAEYLGIGERRLKELVDAGQISAYKIGGAFLRFKKKQLTIAKTLTYQKKGEKKDPTEPLQSRSERFKDFLYFNDFYILSIVVVVIAIVLMVAT